MYFRLCGRRLGIGGVGASEQEKNSDTRKPTEKQESINTAPKNIYSSRAVRGRMLCWCAFKGFFLFCRRPCC